jgi:hypothetical protein
MGKFRPTLVAMLGVIVCLPSNSAAEYFKAGHVACDSREHLEQFLAIWLFT